MAIVGGIQRGFLKAVKFSEHQLHKRLHVEKHFFVEKR